MEANRHRELMREAITRDGDAQRALIDGDLDAARTAFAEAAERYRESWVQAPPGSYGRLVGMLKSAILAGDYREQASYIRAELQDAQTESATAAYAQALAALIVGDDAGAEEFAGRMRGGSEAFDRTADAIASLARRDQPAYAAAVEAIVRDFEQRTKHLTNVPIADTALMLERLAAQRAITADVKSPLLPPVGADRAQPRGR